ncbi:MAG: DUF1919 domain-containing protein [Flavobacteriales bacterium]|nr:DUF1919 domain-containing protein [Flavobacteriales bacterium]
MGSKHLNRSFSIIANNCWGAEVCKHYNLPFNTPIIGLFFYPDCYLKFVENLEKNLTTEIGFIQQSKYHHAPVAYPVGLVNGVEIHFLHYKSEQEAFDKWTRRSKRVSFKDGEVLFKFDDRDGATPAHIHRYFELGLPNAICFTKQAYPEHNMNVQVAMPASAPSVMDGFALFKESIKYFDLDEWINGKGVVAKPIHRFNALKRKLLCALK